MSICKNCKEEIEWKEKKDKSGSYPVNPGKPMGATDFFHSATCGKKADPYVDEPKPMSGYSMGDAISETKEAIKDHLDIKWTSEDLRAFSISIWIQRNR